MVNKSEFEPSDVGRIYVTKTKLFSQNKVEKQGFQTPCWNSTSASCKNPTLNSSICLIFSDTLQAQVWITERGISSAYSALSELLWSVLVFILDTIFSSFFPSLFLLSWHSVWSYWCYFGVSITALFRLLVNKLIQYLTTIVKHFVFSLLWFCN